jgi:hypothetical protein
MNKSQFLYLSVAAAVAFSLAACAPPAQPDSQSQTPKESGAASRPGESPAAASPGTPPDATPETSSPGGSSPAPAPTGTATDLPAAELKTFTFPDGHISFSYPADWTVRVAPAPHLPGSADAGNSLEAVLADGSGNEVASMASGTYGDGAEGPVSRTVLDQAPVAGLVDMKGEQASFGFAFDSFADHPQFHMGIRRSQEFTTGTTSSGTAQVVLPNGSAIARVIFGEPAFPTVDEAKAWMNTAQYRQLKALLLSVKYE